MDALHLEQVMQSADLLSQLTDELGVSVLIDDSLTDDLLRPVRVPGGREINWGEQTVNYVFNPEIYISRYLVGPYS